MPKEKKPPHEVLIHEIRHNAGIMDHLGDKDLTTETERHRVLLLGGFESLLRMATNMIIPAEHVDQVKSALLEVREKSSSQSVKGCLNDWIIQNIST